MHCHAALKWSSIIKMRRVPAILLVFLFSFSPIGPALFVDAESNLPACCRRDGKHHCGMMAPGIADAWPAGLVVRAVRIKCPFFPNSAVVPESGPALPVVSQATDVSIISQIADQAQVEAGYRISLNRSHRKRGPPILSS